MRPSIDDQLWTTALRVVLTSVRRHSERRDGDVDYLNFVSAYIL